MLELKLPVERCPNSAMDHSLYKTSLRKQALPLEEYIGCLLQDCLHLKCQRFGNWLVMLALQNLENLSSWDEELTSEKEGSFDTWEVKFGCRQLLPLRKEEFLIPASFLFKWWERASSVTFRQFRSLHHNLKVLFYR